MSLVWRKRKINKYFLNPEKKQAEKSTIQRLAIDEKDFAKHNDINDEIFSLKGHW